MFNFFSGRCYNGGNKHNFQPRITSESTMPEHVDTQAIMHSAFAGDEVEALEAAKHEKEIYHGDVCTWCGLVVNKP